MSALVALVRREFRDARWSMLAAMVLSLLGLGLVGVLDVRPRDVPGATAMVLRVELAIWTLLFSADLFAADFASGRMATKALLPVSSWMILVSKFVYLILALAITATLVLWGALGLQIAIGDEDSLQQFVHLLPALAHVEPWLFPLAAGAALCSLLFETSLSATVLTLGAGVSTRVAAQPVTFALSYVGIEWGPWEWSLASWGGAALLLATGIFAFVRGQRRLGQRAVRAKEALQFVGASVSVGALCVGPMIWLRATSELRTPNVRFVQAASTPDGRLLALMAERWMRGAANVPTAVWLLDLDSGERELVARPGKLLVDPAWRAMPSSFDRPKQPAWDAAHPLLVLRSASGVEADALAVDVSGEHWEIAPTDGDKTFDSHSVPAWAEMRPITNFDGSVLATEVWWKERGLHARFEARSSTGCWFLPSPVPGKILVARGEKIVLRDMESGTERVVLDEGAPDDFSPSPDGSAVLVYGADETRVLSSSDGALLHEPWPRAGPGVQWMDGSGAARVVQLGRSRFQGAHLIDLDMGREIQLECFSSLSLLLRVGDRGYVYVGRGGDLVWADLDGKLVKVLVDR